MHRVMGFLVGMLLVAGCAEPESTSEEAANGSSAPLRMPEVSVLVSGAHISGANGMHFSPDGRLFIASVLGSELVVLDPNSGAILERLTDGIDGPDDVAFNAAGDFYWTSILTGEVAGMTAGGERITAARLDPGVNPITFSDNGRLFVAQCFFGDKLYEVDPKGIAQPRLIADDLGPGCGLNGMDWGPDDRLYGPRWFHGEVVSFDVDSAERRVEADGFQVPAAVKFDSRGVLHVLDTAAGTVIRIGEGERQVVASLPPGLDNFAFDAADRLFVSSFVDGTIWRVVPPSAPEVILPGGLAHPGGIAARRVGDQVQLLVADLHALRTFDASTGKALHVERNILGVGELGSVLSVSVDDDALLLTAFTDPDVRIWDPEEGRQLARFEGVQAPVSAIRYRGMLVVSEHVSGQVRTVGDPEPVVLAGDLSAPTDLLTDGDSLWVSDRSAGTVLRIARDGKPIEPEVLASGLMAPEGLALWRGRVLVREGETGRVLALGDGTPAHLVNLGAGSPPSSGDQPPAMVLNDLVVVDDTLYATNELDRQVVRVDLDASML